MAPSPVPVILQLYFILNYLFILSALLIYSFTKKKLRQLPLHKKFYLRNKGECIELCTSFSKAKVETLRTMKNGFKNCSPYIATQP